MSDRLLKLANSPITGKIIKSSGLPSPVYLKREKGNYGIEPLKDRKIIVSQAESGFLSNSINDSLKNLGANYIDNIVPQHDKKYEVVIFDATGCHKVDHLKQVYEFFHKITKNLTDNSRVVIFAGAEYKDAESAATAKGIEGFTRAYAKELGRKGSTANLVYVHSDATDRILSAIRFFGTGRTAYVSGQCITISKKLELQSSHSSDLLLGKVALVTGAARGLGAATAKRLANEGAKVICLDVSFAQDALNETVKAIEGVAYTADISSENTPKELCDFIEKNFGKIDIIIHNAGITRDKTLGNMTPQQWDQVIGVNLKSIINLDKEMLERNLINSGGRIICLSSVSGIAGNAGQCNYSTSKAALINYVAEMSNTLAKKGITINAVAPGFIETEMTKKIPAIIREFGRRLNSLSQGGQPEDVAELVTFLSLPDSCGITGQTIRVCGQSLIGA